MSFKNMTIGRKLLLGFLSIALLVAVMGHFGVRGTRQISKSFDVAANSSIPAIRALLEIKSTANEIGAQIAGFQLIGDALSREEGTETGAQKYALIGKVEKIDWWAERYERALLAGEGDVRLTFAQKLREAEASVVNNVFELLALKERAMSGTELRGKTQELARAQDRLEGVIAEAIDNEMAHITEQNLSVYSAAEAMLRVNVWVSLLTFVFATSVGLVFARSIGTPIKRLKESVERFGTDKAGGPAQAQLGPGDEIGQLWHSFNQMTERLDKTTVSRDILAHELVERRKAEQALAAENAFRRAIENSARAGIVAIDLGGHLIYANRSFCDMVGWSEGEVLGAVPPFNWWPPEETDTIGAVLQDTLVGNLPSEGRELRFQRRNGERFDVLVLAAPLKDDDDQTTGWLASTYDITDRTLAQEEITILAKFPGENPNPVMRMAKDGVLQYANAPSEPLLDQFGCDIGQVVPEFCQRIIEDALDSNSVKEIDIDCEERVFSCVFAPVADAGYVNFYARDVTDRTLAEEENQRLALAVANASDAVIITGMDGRISFVNPAAEKLYGYAPSEMLGIRVLDMHPESFRQTTAREIFEATRNEGSWTGEVPVLNKTGEELPVMLSTALMKDDEGHALGMVGIATDVTERRQLQEQLVQSQKMEAIGRLAGGVAHDFNNLLTAMLGYAQLGLSGLPVGEGRTRTRFLEIQKAAERAAVLTQKLLAFSRHQAVEPRVISLSDLIVDMDGMLRRLIGEDIELMTLAAPDSGMVRADPGQMEQVLTNLAVNARHAMPDGGKVIIETLDVGIDQEHAERHPETNTGDYVVLAVTDTGIGMTKEVKSHVFEPFFTTKGVGEGTGLGLSTCYGIVAKSGGYITVESEPGKGATFKVYLPRVGEPPSQPTPARDKLEESPLGTETVFLVEDEPIVRNMASQVLREQGYNVLESTNGVEALKVVEERASEELHLLLTDVVMPLMGGRDLAERLRTQHPETRVLYTSGYTDVAVVHADPGESSTDFIQKPFTPVALALKVREVLDR